jgi:hypothetical protein
MVTNSIIARVGEEGKLNAAKVLGPQVPKDIGEMPDDC